MSFAAQPYLERLILTIDEQIFTGPDQPDQNGSGGSGGSEPRVRVGRDPA
jgi:hypothetical protein